MLAQTSLVTNTSALDEALRRHARGEESQLACIITEVETHFALGNTKAKCHCYSLAHDANGRIRVASLIEEIFLAVVDYAVPRSSIAEAKEYFDRTGSASEVLRLRNEAMSVFTSIKTTGEGGELLLFLLAEKVLRLPQLLCKMDLKTDGNVHFQGADGIHVGVDPSSEKLALYWGESKMYSDPYEAIYECIKSLAPMLNSTFGEKDEATRDLQLLRRYVNFEDEELVNALKKFLNPREPCSNRVEFKGICFVGFDADCYPSGSQTITMDEISKAVHDSLPAWKTILSRRICAENIHTFDLHVFCLPFPSVEQFRSDLISQL